MKHYFLENHYFEVEDLEMFYSGTLDVSFYYNEDSDTVSSFDIDFREFNAYNLIKDKEVKTIRKWHMEDAKSMIDDESLILHCISNRLTSYE